MPGFVLSRNHCWLKGKIRGLGVGFSLAVCKVNALPAIHSSSLTQVLLHAKTNDDQMAQNKYLVFQKLGRKEESYV